MESWGLATSPNLRESPKGGGGVSTLCVKYTDQKVVAVVDLNQQFSNKIYCLGFFLFSVLKIIQ